MIIVLSVVAIKFNLQSRFSTMPLSNWSRDRESVNDIEPGEMCLKTPSV